jgi:tetratricopeptide (TPR) repeat protein
MYAHSFATGRRKRAYHLSASMHFLDGRAFLAPATLRKAMCGRRYDVLLFIVSSILLPGAVGSSWAQTQSLTPAQQKADSAYQEGMRLLRQRHYAEALERFKEVEQFTPHLPQGYTGEGISLALMGKPEQAVAALHKALEIDPTYWVARRELGIIEWQLNRRDEAAKDLAQVAKLFPDDPSVNVILGEYQFENKNYAQANELFSKSSAQVATSSRLSLMAAQALIKTGQFQKAAASLEALTLAPGLTPQQRFQVAWLLGEAKNYSKAIQAFNALPRDFSDPFGRGYGLALAYYESGQYAKCVKTLFRLEAQGMTRPELFSLLGAAEEKSGHTLQAYDAFRQGIYRFPHDDENYLNISTLAVQHFNYDVALQVLGSGIREIPNDYKLFLTRGVVYTLRKELVKAQADYEKALALAPQESSAYVSLGICFMDQDRYAEAAQIFRQGIQKQVNDVLLYYFLADSLFRQGITASSPLYQEALDAVQRSIHLDPNFAYAYLQRGRLELIRNETDEAIRDFERARQLAPDSRTILYQLGVAYRKAGRKDEAEKLFARVSEASKEEAAQFRKGKLMEIMVTLSNNRAGPP